MQETAGVDVQALIADWAAVAAVLEGRANAEGMEGHYMLHSVVEAVGSAAAAVGSSGVLVKLRLAAKHLLVVAGLSSS